MTYKRIRLLLLDDLQEKIQQQKSAAPVPTPVSVEEACAHLDTMKYNVVVNEKGIQDEVDINAQVKSVLQDIVDKFKQKTTKDTRNTTFTYRTF